jgi:hypothetical protein
MLYGQSFVESNRRTPSNQAGLRPAASEEDMTEHPSHRAVSLVYINSDTNGTLNLRRAI